MRLDQNAKGRGKYALLKLRRLNEIRQKGGYQAGDVEDALMVLENAGILDYGTEPATEFFVMRLKDINSRPALRAYANAAASQDAEYAYDVHELADRAGRHHPDCKFPD